MAEQDELGHEPPKLTEEMRSEISVEHPIDENVRITEPEKYTDEAAETPKAPVIQEREARKMRTRRKKRENKEPISLSRFHRELLRHSDARKKTDLVVKDIEMQLKSLLLAHHSAIRELKKQVTHLNSRMVMLESRKSKIPRMKISTKKTTSKKSPTKMSKKKSSRTKSRK